MINQQLFHNFFKYKEGNLYWKISPSPSVNAGDVVGHITHQGYARTSVGRKKYLVHQIIFFMHYGYFPKCIDHIDGNKLNNLIDNLRESTFSQNQYNSKLPKHNTSGIKGVSWNTNLQKWVVRMNHNRKTYQRCVQDLELAELVAIEMRSKLHGSYANQGV